MAKSHWHGNRIGNLTFRTSFTVLLDRYKAACKHIRIFTKASGLGFSEPFQFLSLENLIQYYSEELLSKHTSELPITLKYPVFMSRRSSAAEWR